MRNPTPAQLDVLLATLQREQHALIDAAAGAGGVPAKSVVREVADLENAIAAVLALIEERSTPAR